VQVEKEFPDWELYIFGEGDRTPYVKLMEKLGIHVENCHLEARSSDIENEYCHSSLFVFSSRFEGFGMVLVEAMVCGLPVVSFDCSCGPKDIVKDGEDGLLIEAGDVSALANGLRSLMSNPEKRISMSEAAQKNAKRFKIEYVAQQWQQLFETVKNKRE
jgi:glycosyltransferase involved in cell wall biosynthesis